MMTQELLKNRFEYIPEEGNFFDKHYDKVVGRLSKNGYTYIPCKGGHYLAHRLAVLYMTGSWPTEDVDHINGVRNDNRWSNLRQCTRSENLFNRSPNLNRLLPKNVYWQPHLDRYRVKMKIDGITTHFGYFNDLKEATEVAEKAQRDAHGEFAYCLQRGQMDSGEIQFLCDLDLKVGITKMGA